MMLVIQIASGILLAVLVVLIIAFFGSYLKIEADRRRQDRYWMLEQELAQETPEQKIARRMALEREQEAVRRRAFKNLGLSLPNEDASPRPPARAWPVLLITFGLIGVALYVAYQYDHRAATRHGLNQPLPSRMIVEVIRH